MSYVQKGSKLYLSDGTINHSDTYYAQDGSSLVLAHHGILGMKHGERRYQNKDGSLTELGKQRRRLGRKTTRSTKPTVDDSKWHQDYRNARKDYHEMSDQELQKSINRLRNETAYKELIHAKKCGLDKTQKVLSNAGNKFVDATAKQVATASVKAASKQIAKMGGVALASLATYVGKKRMAE